MNDSTIPRYPLTWPTGWKRTSYASRGRAKFHTTKSVTYEGGGGYRRKESLSVGDAMGRLEGELRRLGAQRVIVSSNLRLRNDGLPMAAQAKQLEDPGIAVYFRLGGKSRVLACDRWSSAAENIAAIAGHINAIRAVDRYGVGTIEQAFAGYAALPADSAANWRQVLGFSEHETVTADMVNRTFKARATTAHPDKGGTDEGMAHLNRAREFALQELLG